MSKQMFFAVVLTALVCGCRSGEFENQQLMHASPAAQSDMSKSPHNVVASQFQVTPQNISTAASRSLGGSMNVYDMISYWTLDGTSSENVEGVEWNLIIDGSTLLEGKSEVGREKILRIPFQVTHDSLQDQYPHLVQLKVKSKNLSAICEALLNYDVNPNKPLTDYQFHENAFEETLKAVHFTTKKASIELLDGSATSLNLRIGYLRQSFGKVYTAVLSEAPVRVLLVPVSSSDHNFEIETTTDSEGKVSLSPTYPLSEQIVAMFDWTAHPRLAKVFALIDLKRGTINEIARDRAVELVGERAFSF